ncbi:hypothetical protein [Halomicrobium sp. LC1Hm]|uniref:hypothetical protein n=1 Tax=Halomicrobium sp. LC1Hm TaxID=2610902 RepID=UPI001298449B|nr:hypothetical protein [Halomicrobium sp. LC1Hm]
MVSAEAQIVGVVSVDGGERTRRDIFDNNATGVFVVTAKVPNSPGESYQWNFSEEPADGWVHISIEAENAVNMTYAIA